MKELEAIKARLSAAVPGPWSLSLDFQRKWMLLLAGSGTADEYRIAKLADDDTAEFIAHSPADIAKLIAALEAIGKLAEEWQKTPRKPTTFDAALHHASIQIQTALMEIGR